jgi:hypothetical protein
VPDLGDREQEEFARLMASGNRAAPQYAGHARAIRENDAHKHRARQARVPFTIHRLAPKRQSELGRLIDQAIFAMTTRQMNGRAWPDQQLDTVGSFVRPESANWFWLACRSCSH